MANEYNLDDITVVSNIPNADGTPRYLSATEVYEAYQNGTLGDGNTIYVTEGNDIINASQVNDNNIKGTDYWEKNYGDTYTQKVMDDAKNADSSASSNEGVKGTDYWEKYYGGTGYSGPTINITNVDDLISNCNDILSLVEEYATTLNTLDSNTKNVVNAWTAEDPSARDLYVNAMYSCINGSNDHVLPAIRDFANYLLAFAEAYKENMSTTNK